MERRYLFISASKPVTLAGLKDELVTFPHPDLKLMVGMTIDIQQEFFYLRGWHADYLDEHVVKPGHGKWLDHGTPAEKLKAEGQKPVVGGKP